PFLAKYLIRVEPSLEKRIECVGKLENFDAVIATGSNNTARYFEYYFKDKPNMIRKNRTSVAVLEVKESERAWIALGKDSFTYLGLRCRGGANVVLPNG